VPSRSAPYSQGLGYSHTCAARPVSACSVGQHPITAPRPQAGEDALLHSAAISHPLPQLAAGEAQLEAQLNAARQRSASDRAASARANPPPAVQLPADSVGYRLLRAAGWRPGAGLGSKEQGIAAPLQVSGRAGQRRSVGSCRSAGRLGRACL